MSMHVRLFTTRRTDRALHTRPAPWPDGARRAGSPRPAPRRQRRPVPVPAFLRAADAVGDPDLQAPTRTRVSGIPMERPASSPGAASRHDAGELARSDRQIRRRGREDRHHHGRTEDNDTSTGPSHWYQNYNATNGRRGSYRPADGKIPATTEPRRPGPPRQGGRHRGNGPTSDLRRSERPTPVRALDHPRRAGSMMPAIYGNSSNTTPGPDRRRRLEMVHDTHVIPLDG